MSVLKSGAADSKAMVVYQPRQGSEEFLRSELERITNEVFRRSLRTVKYEMDHIIVCPSHLDPEIVSIARSRRLLHILPPLNGPYSTIGHTSFIIEDPSVHAAGDRKIGVEVYAPTRNSNGEKFRLRSDDFLETVLSEEQLQTFYTHSFDHLEPIGKKLPIIIFSHGFGVDPIEYCLLLETLASHGYVVLNLNHPSSSGYASFSEEALDFSAFEKIEDKEAFLDQLTLTQASNLQVVVEQIRNGKILHGLGLPHQIVLAGHSLGGAASIIASNNNPHIEGCINLDGGLRNEETITNGLTVPVLTLLSDHKLDRQEDGDERVQQIFRDWETFHQKSKTSYKGTIDNITHMDFCSAGTFVNWLLGENISEDVLKVHNVAPKVMVQFINSIHI